MPLNMHLTAPTATPKISVIKATVMPAERIFKYRITCCFSYRVLKMVDCVEECQ